MAKTSKLRPHQRSIVTRFVFVMPLRTTPSNKMFDHVVPCEPEDATSYAIMEWDARHLMWNTSDVVEAIMVETPELWRQFYERARDDADSRDRFLAQHYGVER